MINSAAGWGFLFGSLLGSKNNQKELRLEDVDIDKLESFLAEAKYAQHKKDYLWWEGDIEKKIDQLAKDRDEDKDKKELFGVIFDMMSKNAITTHEMEIILSNLR